MTRSTWRSTIGGGIAAFVGLVFLLRPTLIAGRFKPPPGATENFPAIAQSLGLGLAVTLIAFGLLGALWPRVTHAQFRIWAPIAATIVAYLGLAQPLAWWMIDDAAITFAYSENLVRGYGLTLHPSLPPEEGYSNTSWMLWLAGLRVLGFDLPAAAKMSCLVLGVLTIVCLHRALQKMNASAEPGEKHEQRPLWYVPAVCLLGAPYLVWSVSGLEHGLQALAILSVATSPLLSKRAVWIGAVWFSVLVLTRPEAPLLVAVSFAVWVWYAKREGTWFSAVKSGLPLALVPALVWFGLIVFRLQYFGDPLPNPFYAKASDATFARLLNPLGGGWDYVLSWAFGSGIVVALPVIARACLLGSIPLPVALALGQLGAHLSFVIYASGDWMACWRFISPIVPILAFLAGWSYPRVLREQSEADAAVHPAPTNERRAFDARGALVGLTLGCLALGGTKQYLAFLATPTTPYTVVAAIGQRFADLGAGFGLTDPILAHHDAGGTSYKARIHLLDLAGLGNRTVAKHLHDAEFLTRYILSDIQPDFIFGVSNNFAAGNSLFWQKPEFEQRYVPLEFVNDPNMVSGLCHIKRALLNTTTLPAGVALVRENGEVTKVTVN